jgi:hypothetical protein
VLKVHFEATGAPSLLTCLCLIDAPAEGPLGLVDSLGSLVIFLSLALLSQETATLDGSCMDPSRQNESRTAVVI